jgi:hypothetical protein
LVQVLDPIAVKLAEFESLKKLMRDRELCKVDYDARFRKVMLHQHQVYVPSFL